VSRRVGATAAAALAWAGVTACAGDTASGDGPTRLDSAGVVIVELPALAPPTSWALEPAWSVEAFDGEPVFDVAGMTVVAPGRLAVVEGGQGGAHIRLLAATDGQLLVEAGGAGDGPGEFGYPRGVVPLGDGDIGVWDTRPSRFTVLGPDLELVRTGPMPDLDVVGLPELHPAEGGLWVWTASQLGPPLANEPLVRDSGVLAFWSGETADTVAVVPGLEYVANGTIVGAPPWGAMSWSAAHPEGVWIGDTALPEVRLYGRDGLERIVRWPAETRPRTESHDDRYLTLVEELAPPGIPPEAMEQVASLLVVEELPQWGLLASADDGALWISSAPELGLPVEFVGPGPARDWVVFDAEGVPRARVTTPAGYTVHDIEGDLVFGVQRDALGRESLRALRIVVGPSGG